MPDGSSPIAHYGHPWSLEFFLDAGVDLVGFPRLNLLAEEVLVHRRHDDLRERRAAAFAARVSAVEVFGASDGEDPMGFCVYYLWLAELLEGKELVERFRESLPEAVVARCDGIAWGLIDPEADG